MPATRPCALRSAVIADLTARGADLAPLVETTLARTQPSLALAANLYGDASREGEIVPVHPLFCARSFKRLAS